MREITKQFARFLSVGFDSFFRAVMPSKFISLSAAFDLSSPPLRLGLEMDPFDASRGTRNFAIAHNLGLGGAANISPPIVPATSVFMGNPWTSQITHDEAMHVDQVGLLARHPSRISAYINRVFRRVQVPLMAGHQFGISIVEKHRDVLDLKLSHAPPSRANDGRSRALA